MRIPGAKTVKTFSRWLRARVLGGAVILGYHRVTKEERDEYEICVTPEHFAQQMAAISKYARPIDLATLVQHLKNGTLPARSVAVTFDDGYADNLYHAKPVLERYGIPATVFVCTGYAGKEFWWDELERLVMCSQAEPQTLGLQMVEKNAFQWNPLVAKPTASSERSASSRRALRDALYNFLLPMDTENRELSMDVIRYWARLALDGSPVSRAMNQSELLQLTDGGLVELGSHTRSHPMLPQLTLQRQREEVISGKKDIESLLGKPIAGFAYPNGRATPDAKNIVRDAGFAYACTSLHDVVRPGSDLFALTRFWQKDVDGDTFLKGLHLWLKGARF